jgi:hypothetical protein
MAHARALALDSPVTIAKRSQAFAIGSSHRVAPSVPETLGNPQFVRRPRVNPVKGGRALPLPGGLVESLRRVSGTAPVSEILPIE